MLRVLQIVLSNVLSVAVLTVLILVVVVVDPVVRVAHAPTVMAAEPTVRVTVPHLVENLVEILVRVPVVLLVLMTVLPHALERANHIVRIVLHLEKKPAVLTIPVEEDVLLNVHRLVKTCVLVAM